ncbi:hypothetical protein ScPMuIL_005515 [Solemya velum]
MGRYLTLDQQRVRAHDSSTPDGRRSSAATNPNMQSKLQNKSDRVNGDLAFSKQTVYDIMTGDILESTVAMPPCPRTHTTPRKNTPLLTTKQKTSRTQISKGWNYSSPSSKRWSLHHYSKVRGCPTR